MLLTKTGGLKLSITMYQLSFFREIIVQNLIKTGKIKCVRAHYSFNLTKCLRESAKKMMRFALLSIMVILLIFFSLHGFKR